MRVILPRLNELIKIFFNERIIVEFKFDYLFVNLYLLICELFKLDSLLKLQFTKNSQ